MTHEYRCTTEGCSVGDCDNCRVVTALRKALTDIYHRSEPLALALAIGTKPTRYELLAEIQRINRLIVDASVCCSRCQSPIRDFEPPMNGVTAGYYLASAFPKYANDGDVYICDACMWKDPLYVLDHGAVPNGGDV